MKTKICVLGAGCTGLSCAVTLAQSVKTSLSKAANRQVDIEIWVVADRFHPNTTSDVAAGIWDAYETSGIPRDLAKKWSERTLSFMEETYRSSTEAGKMGLFPCMAKITTDLPDGEVDIPKDNYFRGMRNYQGRLSRPASGPGRPAQFSLSVQTMVLDQSYYLPWLQRRCNELGVHRRQMHVETLESLGAEFDAVVNCTGLGASSLVGDAAMCPIRGQIYRVIAPWIKHTELLFTENSLTYIIPQVDCVVLGGTAQVSDWHTETRPEDSNRIWEQCCKIVPSLAGAAIIKRQVGLRPKRTSGVRLEAETLPLDRKGPGDGSSSRLFVVHNYGHGGIGITLHYGCTLDAVALMLEWLGSRHRGVDWHTVDSIVPGADAVCKGTSSLRHRSPSVTSRL